VTVPAFLSARGFEVAAVIVLVLLAGLADDWAQFVFGYFRGREAMGFESGVTAIAAIARTVGGIAIAVTTHRLIAVVIWMLVTSGAQAAWAGQRLREALRERPWARLRGKLPPLDWRGIAAMSLIGFFATIYLRADSVIIGSIYSDRTVGYYTGAYALVGGLQIVPWMIAVAATPVFARSFEGADDLFDSSWQESLRVVLVLALPFALVTCLLADPIVHLLFGARFRPAGPALAILVWSSPLWALNMLLAGLLRGAGRTLVLTAVTGFGALVNIGLNLWAVRAYGINGAATVTVATEAAVLVVLVAVAVRQGIVRPPRLPLAGLSCGLAALSAIAVLGRSWPVVLTAVLALGAYLVVVRVTGVITDGDVATVRRVVRRGG
jgi:O-antigen/teichoic acid export membrane protein